LPKKVEPSDFTPLTFSANVDVAPAEVVFAGYGIVAPKTEKHDEYDSYVHLDVKDKWAMVFRFVPEDLTPEQRQHFKFYSGLRKKAFHARKNGAIGLIVVSGPTSQVKNQLVPMRNDFASASPMPSQKNGLREPEKTLPNCKRNLTRASPVWDSTYWTSKFRLSWKLKKLLDQDAT